MLDRQIGLQDSQKVKIIWEAAYWDKKFSKTVIDEFSVKEAINVLTAQGRLWSLRVSGCLLLGINKIVNKKSNLILDLVENIESHLSMENFSSVEVLKLNRILEVGSVTIYNKSANSFNPDNLVKLTGKVQKTKKVDPNTETKIQDENQNTIKEVERFGISNSFLDDIELAQRWASEEPALTLPQKRKPTSIWESLVTQKHIAPTPSPSFYESFDPAPTVSREPKSLSVPKARKRFKKLKIENPTLELTLQPSNYASLDCTSDITKNQKYINNPSTIKDLSTDLCLYQPTIPEIPLTLMSFFTSNLKINKIKEALMQVEPLGANPVTQYLTSPEIPTAQTQPSLNPKNSPEKVDSKLIKQEFDPEPEFTLSNYLTTRTLKMLKLLQSRLVNLSSASLNFFSLTRFPTRRTLSCGFYELLLLTQKDLISLSQIDSSLQIYPNIKLIFTNIF